MVFVIYVWYYHVFKANFVKTMYAETMVWNHYIYMYFKLWYSYIYIFFEGECIKKMPDTLIYI